MEKISTKKPARPEKPTDDFPLFPHASGQWAKKIRGKMCYFGVWADPDAALKEYERQRRYLERGQAAPDSYTIAELVYDFLDFKESRVKTGELSMRSFKDYTRICRTIVNFFGEDQVVSELLPADFGRLRNKLAETLNFQTLGNEVSRIRIVFRFGSEEKKYEKLSYGQQFARPSRKVLRSERQQKQRKHGKRMLQGGEMRLLLTALEGKPVAVSGKDDPVTLTANPILRAMVLLACNAGLGQSDLAGIPLSAIDLETGWMDYERPKTAVERKAPLWSETLQAVREAIELRPKAKHESDSDKLFLTKYGTPWIKVTAKSNDDAIAKEFSKVLKALNLKRPGLNFYSLRHLFQTVGAESKDPQAVSSIMGHVDDSMGGLYSEGISDERLKAVVDVVHRWLFPPAE